MTRDRDASTAQQIKTRRRSTMKMNLLNSLLIISVIDPSLENKRQIKTIVVEAVSRYE